MCSKRLQDLLHISRSKKPAAGYASNELYLCLQGRCVRQLFRMLITYTQSPFLYERPASVRNCVRVVHADAEEPGKTAPG
jgi:hypothetical protein